MKISKDSQQMERQVWWKVEGFFTLLALPMQASRATGLQSSGASTCEFA